MPNTRTYAIGPSRRPEVSVRAYGMKVSITPPERTARRRRAVVGHWWTDWLQAKVGERLFVTHRTMATRCGSHSLVASFHSLPNRYNSPLCGVIPPAVPRERCLRATRALDWRLRGRWRKTGVMSHGFEIRHGCDAVGRVVWRQKRMLAHKDVRTTMIYTHVVNRGGRGVGSPADILSRRPDERY
jgi:hypothetical protein